MDGVSDSSLSDSTAAEIQLMKMRVERNTRAMRDGSLR